MQTDLSAFIKENIARLKQTSPKFFKVWGKINMIVLIIAGLPTVLDWAQQVFEFDISAILPHAYWLRVLLKIVAFCGAWGKVMTSLSVTSSHEVVSDNGLLLQKPCTDLPFTEKKEDAKILEPKTV